MDVLQLTAVLTKYASCVVWDRCPSCNLRPRDNSLRVIDSIGVSGALKGVCGTTCASKNFRHTSHSKKVV